jgi:hypothetical protein
MYDMLGAWVVLFQAMLLEVGLEIVETQNPGLVAHNLLLLPAKPDIFQLPPQHHVCLLTAMLPTVMLMD